MTAGRAALRRWGLALLAIALLLALGYVALRAGPLAPTRVTVVEAGRASVAPALFGIGTVEARRSLAVGPTVAGRVLRVAVDVGDRVKAGQLLAEMDPVDLDQRLAALDAGIARAGSAAAAAEAQRRDAVARQALALSNTRRYAELAAQGFFSAGALQARQQEQASADAGLAAAAANLAAAQQDARRLAAERAGLALQRMSLKLLAPTAGLVTSRDAEPGATVVAGQAVLRLVEPASLWLRVRFDAGLAPIVLNKSFQAQFLVPMAITIAYGLLIATFITLFLLPVYLVWVNTVKRWAFWAWNARMPEAEAVEPAVKEIPFERMDHDA